MKKRFKKSKVIFLAVVMAFSILQAVCAFAAAASPSLEMKKPEDAKADADIMIPVSINGNPGFSSFNMEVTVPDGWTMSCDQEGSILSGSLAFNPDKGLLGYMHNANTNENGELFRLHVKAPDSTKTGDYKITIKVKEMTSDISTGSKDFSKEFHDASCVVRVDGKTDVSGKIRFARSSSNSYVFDENGVELNGLTTQAAYPEITADGAPKVTYRLVNQYGYAKEFVNWGELGDFLTRRQELDAGRYTMSTIYVDNTQWGQKSFDFEVEKFSIDVVNWEWETPGEFRYDGTTRSVALKETNDNWEFTTASYRENTGTDTKDYKASASVSVKDEYSRNYKVVGRPPECPWKITKAQAVNCRADSFTRLVRYDKSDPQVFSGGDIKAAFREGNPGKTLGSVVTIDNVEITSDPNGILAAPKVENNSVSYQLKGGLTAGSVGSTAEITVTFTSANYEQSTMIFAVTVTDKEEHTITVEPSKNGHLNVTPPDKAAEGTTVTIDAIPDEGYALKELTIKYDNKTIHLVRDEDSGEFIIQP